MGSVENYRGIPVERAGYMLPETLRSSAGFPRGGDPHPGGLAPPCCWKACKRGETNLVVIPKNEDGLGPELQEELDLPGGAAVCAGPGVVTPDMLTEDGAYIRMEKVTDLPFIILKRAMPSAGRWTGYSGTAAPPNIIMETTSNINAVQLANSGYGATIVPERAVEIFGGREKFNCYPLGRRTPGM